MKKWFRRGAAQCFSLIRSCKDKIKKEEKSDNKTCFSRFTRFCKTGKRQPRLLSTIKIWTLSSYLSRWAAYNLNFFISYYDNNDSRNATWRLAWLISFKDTSQGYFQALFYVWYVAIKTQIFDWVFKLSLS